MRTSVLAFVAGACFREQAVDTADTDEGASHTTPDGPNAAPTVAIAEPADGSSFEEGRVVTFTASVTDDRTPPGNLHLTWESDVDGELPEGSPPTAGGSVLYQIASLSAAPPSTAHRVSLTVQDDEGATASALVVITIEDVADLPAILVVHPTEDESGREGEDFQFVALAVDIQDRPTELEVYFESSLEGVFCTEVPDDDGKASCSATLQSGDHWLAYTVFDTDGNNAAAPAFFPVVAQANSDDDGDGWTPAEGDCDDADPMANPGGTEACGDDVDGDCDGFADGVDAIGCATWWTDDDGDGYGDESRCLCAASEPYTATSGGDCYDGNAAAHPGQGQYSDVDRGDGSFDFDCDGAETPFDTATYSCDATTCDLVSAGWRSDVPACGAVGDWVNGCTAGAEGCDTSTESRTQSCI